MNEQLLVDGCIAPHHFSAYLLAIAAQWHLMKQALGFRDMY